MYTLDKVKESIISQFKKDFPNEQLYGKIFSLYLLDKYSNLLLKIYKHAEQNGIIGK